MTKTARVLLILDCFLVIVFIGGFLYFNEVRPNSLSKTTDQPLKNETGNTYVPNPVDVTVQYTAEGFIPKQLEVARGARVAFINTTDIPLWVGSDPHPFHSDYSLFDAKRAYSKGEEFIFTFEHTGTFTYHNHEYSSDRGSVQVTDSDHRLPNIDKTVEGQEEIRDALIAMLKPHDPNSIFEVIDEIQSDPVLRLNCHDIAHDVGHTAYTLYGFSEAMTFNNPNHVDHPLVQYICAGGYMHGILEELSRHNPDFLTNPDVLCTEFPLADQDSCYHGVGHVFMLARAREVDRAIQDCRLVDDLTYVYRCFEGVRMEQFWGNTEHVQTNSLGWTEEDPLAPCVAAAQDERPTCFLYSTFGYLRFHPKDYFGAVNMCTNSNLPESDAQFCLKGLGITMMSKFKGENLQGSENYVAALPIDQRTNFYRGVLGYAHLSGVSKEELRQTCSLFIVDAALCSTVLEEIY
jgi:plastocyanin